MAKPKLSTVKNRLWKLVSEYVRRRYADENGYVACYTCGTVKHWKEGDAGHAIPGRHNAVLFDESILRFQCKYCNGPKSGMQYEFGKRLNEENGDGWFEQKLIDSKMPVKFYISDLLEKEEYYKKKLKSL